MASSSSPSQVICASFNQDNSMFSVGTKDGFKIFDARNGRLCYEKSLGGFNIVEMLFGTNLLAIVGTGEQDRTFVYDLNSTTILDEIETVPNTKGLCAFAPNSEECYLALPASTSKGSALVYKASKPELICQIDAHLAPLAAMVFSLNGMYLATASEKGTMIRVHLVAQATKSHSFRRGTYPSTIYSLAFSPSVDLPDVLVATSSSGSLHMFFLDASRNARRQANTLFSSVIPGSVTDALDPANHHVIHNVVTADIKSCLAVHSVENSQNSSKFPSLKTVIYIVTHNGYFREYLIGTTKSNESSWLLEREFNLLDAYSGSPKQNELHID
ncbi:hypothetical protein ZEAMMB73_Zm00001d018355 [Zea mays]|uniref:Autophagy-related protein 18b n=1 Tax=Zea mays TaxID=4577 RepID=A0A1D6HN13_MAIZE|nr:hypothetical protein ZEAMMB73_Zm00001d018355 [Zea mays]